MEKLWAKVKGWRTILAAGLTALLGIADVFGAIDLRPLVAVLVHGDEAKLGAVMTVLAIIFALLRFVTTTPIGGGKSQ